MRLLWVETDSYARRTARHADWRRQAAFVVGFSFASVYEYPFHKASVDIYILHRTPVSKLETSTDQRFCPTKTSVKIEGEGLERGKNDTSYHIYCQLLRESDDKSLQYKLELFSRIAPKILNAITQSRDKIG